MQFRLKFSVLVFSLCTLLGAGSAMSAANGSAEEAKQVIMFSSTYCPACLHVKRYFETKKIPYKEFDIETSAAARDYFEKLGGRGTPFLLVNNKTMQGFNSARFWKLYGKQ